jgi:hypothetical protein
MGKVTNESSKGKDEEGEGEKEPFTTVFDEVVRGALPGKRSLIAAQYIAKHSVDLRKETKGRNLFIHPSLGGMGCSRPDDFHVHVTKKQREWAGLIISKAPLLIPLIRPLYRKEELMTIDVTPIADPTLLRESVRKPFSGKAGRGSQKLSHGKLFIDWALCSNLYSGLSIGLRDQLLREFKFPSEISSKPLIVGSIEKFLGFISEDKQGFGGVDYKSNYVPPEYDEGQTSEYDNRYDIDY